VHDPERLDRLEGVRAAKQSMRSKNSCVNSGNDVPDRTSDNISTDKIKRQMIATSCKRELTSHCIWANRTFPHFGLAHLGVVLAFCDRPVMTEQSMARWRSILILGSSPGGMGTGSLQRGPESQYELEDRVTQNDAHNQELLGYIWLHRTLRSCVR
jgi:hypothetical protein